VPQVIRDAVGTVLTACVATLGYFAVRMIIS
jgi:hypothetical protein